MLISMSATAATDHPWRSNFHLSVWPTTPAFMQGLAIPIFFSCLDEKYKCLIALMSGKAPSEPNHISTTAYVYYLKSTLQEAYRREREQTSHMLDRRKEFYDEKAHGQPFDPGDLVWLHTTVRRT